MSSLFACNNVRLSGGRADILVYYVTDTYDESCRHGDRLFRSIGVDKQTF